MKKFIFILIGAILMFCSCSTSAVKDIKEISNGEKIVKVKSVNITSDFYKYTHEYIEHCENYDDCKKRVEFAGDSMRENESNMKFYKSIGYDYAYKSYKECYENYKAEWEEGCKELDKYAEINKEYIDNGKQSGKLYVAKIRAKDDITGETLPFNYYEIFTYDSDGTIHSVDTDNNMQITFSVFPEAKKDLKKVMEYTGTMLIDGLANLDF